MTSVFNNKRRIKTAPKGFTILELVFVIAIVALISGVILAGQRQPSFGRELDIDVQKVVQDVRKAQNYALASRIAPCNNNPEVVNYGIHFIKASTKAVYYFFDDCNKNRLWASGETSETTGLLYSATTVLQRFQESIDPTFIIPPGDILDVTFIPPLLDVAVDGIFDSTATITVCHLKNTSLCKNVIVNPRGAVNVQ